MANEVLAELSGGAEFFDAPIPGESLTSSPSERAPYESSPQIVDEQEAIEELFLTLTEEDRFDNLLDLMRAGIPLEQIAQVVLFEGFRQGMWNPDLMLLLIEPTIYLLAFFANYAEIPVVVEEEEGSDLSDEDMELLSSIREEGLPSGVLEGTGTGELNMQRPSSVPESLLTALPERVAGIGQPQGEI